MTARPLAVLDFYLVGNRVTNAEEDAPATGPVVVSSSADASAIERAEISAGPNGQRPTWNDSTICVQIIRDRMTKQGWRSGPAPEIPCVQTEPEVLPNRPSDLGVGSWR